MATEAGLEQARTIETFDAYRGTSALEKVPSLDIKGANFFARKPAFRS